MKNNKGQALVEFVIVVPILIFIIMALIDFSTIATKKLQLENNLNDVVTLYQNKKFDEINILSTNEKFNFSYKTNSNTTIITLTRNIKIMTPFLNLALGNNYNLEVKRTIYEE